tara:strand:- start:995 stop:1666 length:672 start_codon:yes stop_codon:yes gene_type:complete
MSLKSEKKINKILKSFKPNIPYSKYQYLNLTLQDPNRNWPNNFFINHQLNKQAGNFFITLPKVFNKTFEPMGIWFSCGPSWFNYAYEELEDKIQHKEVYNLILDESKLYIINNIPKLQQFQSEYSIPLTKKKDNEFMVIQWDKLSKKYSGFKLCPYFKKQIKKLKNEHDYLWVYNLDVASGCIWNPNCILEVKYGGYLQPLNPQDPGSKKNILKEFKNIIKKL